MEKNLRLGVIGYGLRSTIADLAHRPAAGHQVHALADLDESLLQSFAPGGKRHGRFAQDLLLTTDWRLLLDLDLDAILILSPDFLHEEMAIACLTAGKAVFLEKPMSLDAAGCDRVLAAARASSAKLYLGHNMRHFPVILKMRELLLSGVIGELQAVWCRHFVAYGTEAYFKDWHSERANTNGLLLQKGAHDLDVIHWLASSYSTRVTAMGRLSVMNRVAGHRQPHEKADFSKFGAASNWPPRAMTDYSPVIDIEDMSMMLMQLANGVQASYQQVHYAPDSCRNYTFIGDAGRIENIGDYGRCQIHVYTSRHSRFHAPDQIVHLEPVAGSHGGSDPAMMAEFIRFIRSGIPTNTSPIAARMAVAAGAAATASLRNGSLPQDIPALDPELIAYFENGQRS